MEENIFLDSMQQLLEPLEQHFPMDNKPTAYTKKMTRRETS